MCSGVFEIRGCLCPRHSPGLIQLLLLPQFQCQARPVQVCRHSSPLPFFAVLLPFPERAFILSLCLCICACVKTLSKCLRGQSVLWTTCTGVHSRILKLFQLVWRKRYTHWAATFHSLLPAKSLATSISLSASVSFTLWTRRVSGLTQSLSFCKDLCHSARCPQGSPMW